MFFSSPDHPRGCGEHQALTQYDPVLSGSSPRMRGARVGEPAHPGGQRIIPADAGSTTCWSIQFHASRDHPRGCGEHGSIDIDMEGPEGSSPRMRGAHFSKVSQSLSDRIIPADAGSTP